MEIIVKNLQRKFKINPAQIKKAAVRISIPSGYGKFKVFIYFVSAGAIARLNKNFLRSSRRTDVIAFNLGDRVAEVFIAPSVVWDNSNRFGVGFKEELLRCVVHGVLHVFGFNDTTAKAKNIMWKKQEAILSYLAKFNPRTR